VHNPIYLAAYFLNNNNRLFKTIGYDFYWVLWQDDRGYRGGITWIVNYFGLST
jgi:hypothetical protein